MLDALKNIFSAPVKQSGGQYGVAKDSGRTDGRFGDWFPKRLWDRSAKGRERSNISSRVDDMYLNNPVAHSAVEALTLNSVGQGLQVQSVLPYDKLGLDRKQAFELQDRIEWLWFEWKKNAHFRGQYGFDTLQVSAMRSLIRDGELLHLPVMVKNPGDKFALKIQDLNPVRLRTPYDLEWDKRFHDGIETDNFGRPVAYWIANPEPKDGYTQYSDLTSKEFLRVPVNNGGRKSIFHVFKAEEEEQYRGVSALSPILHYLRNFTETMDNELLAQTIISSMPVFISLENGAADLPDYVREGYGVNGGHPERSYYQSIDGGQVLYGKEGEKPQVLESSRPSQNFVNFADLTLRQIGASLGIPYEVLTKDFSKTNYSSARAAMLEAERVYKVYRLLFEREYCQPIFEMVIEEAFLNGLLELPCTVQSFYENKALWTSTKWAGPARGYIDPQKEIKSQILAIEAGLLSKTDAVAERGGDYEDLLLKLSDEKALNEQFGLKPDNQETGTADNSGTGTGNNSDDDGDDDTGDDNEQEANGEKSENQGNE